MNIKREKPVTGITGLKNKVNRLTITQFNLTEFYSDSNPFLKKLAGLIADDVPYSCVYCREDFTGCGVWMMFCETVKGLINIHVAFSCQTCYREITEAKPAKSAKMKARGLRNLFSIIKNSEVI